MNDLSKSQAAELIGTAIIAFAATAGSSMGGGMGVMGMLGGGMAGAAGGLFLAYAIFHRVSNAHFNPAVSIGMWLAGKMDQGEAIQTSIKQIIGAVAGYLLAWIVTMGLTDFDVTDLPGGAYGIGAGYLGALLLSAFGTAVFVLVYLYMGRIKDESAFGDMWKSLFVSITFGILNAASLVGINLALVVIMFLGAILSGNGDAGDGIVGLVIAVIGGVAGAVLGGQVWKMVTGEGSSIDDIKGSMDKMKGGGGAGNPEA